LIKYGRGETDEVRNIIGLYFYRVTHRIVERLDAMRWGFRNVNRSAGSSIDITVRYYSLQDLILYLPRAIQVSFLSPFPHHWFSSGRETGKIGRLISGAETIIFYFVLCGVIFVFVNDKKILRPLVPVLVFSTLIIVLLGYVVPNVGALYRMRQGMFIPYYIVGVYGLYMWVAVVKAKYND